MGQGGYDPCSGLPLGTCLQRDLAWPHGVHEPHVPQVETLASLKALGRYIDSSQLTPELNGTFPYCHSEWVQFFQVSGTSRSPLPQPPPCPSIPTMAALSHEHPWKSDRNAPERGMKMRALSAAPSCLTAWCHPHSLFSFNLLPPVLSALAWHCSPPHPPPPPHCLPSHPAASPQPLTGHVPPAEPPSLHGWAQASVGAAAELHPGAAEHQRAGGDAGNRGCGTMGCWTFQRAHLQSKTQQHFAPVPQSSMQMFLHQPPLAAGPSPVLVPRDADSGVHPVLAQVGHIQPSLHRMQPLASGGTRS